MFILNLDVSDIIRLENGFDEAAKRAMKEAGEGLTAATHAHIIEQTHQKLHSTREIYERHLDFHPVGDDAWVINLKPGARWIEDGLPPNRSMVDDLLNDGPKPGRVPDPDRVGLGKKGTTKTAKDGSRYRVIPFDHNKGPTKQTTAATTLTDSIKKELKRQKAPGVGTLELDGKGQPKLGLVRSFDLGKGHPVKTGNGPGQGRGPLGAPRQGPTGIPFLQGVRVYQRKVKMKDKATGQDKETVKKFIMTFRIVSSKHKGQGRWIHPGLEPKHFFEEAFEWALEEWEKNVKPKIEATFNSGI